MTRHRLGRRDAHRSGRRRLTSIIHISSSSSSSSAQEEQRTLRHPTREVKQQARQNGGHSTRDVLASEEFLQRIGDDDLSYNQRSAVESHGTRKASRHESERRASGKNGKRRLTSIVQPSSSSSSSSPQEEQRTLRNQTGGVKRRASVCEPSGASGVATLQRSGKRARVLAPFRKQGDATAFTGAGEAWSTTTHGSRSVRHSARKHGYEQFEPNVESSSEEEGDGLRAVRDRTCGTNQTAFRYASDGRSDATSWNVAYCEGQALKRIGSGAVRPTGDGSRGHKQDQEQRAVRNRIREVKRQSNLCASSGASEDARMPHPPRREVCTGMCMESRCEVGWLQDLHSLESEYPDIFTSSEAKLLIATKIGAGKCAYLGIGATMNNCLGLRKVYQTYFRPRERNGCGTAELKQTITTISQFLTWTVVSSFCVKTDVWKEESLFGNVADSWLVIRFIDYFRTRCSPSTVKTKATCLKRVCAVGLVSVADESIKGRLELISITLQNIANASKQAHRVICQDKNREEHRAASGSVISRKDFILVTRRARMALDFIMKEWTKPRRKSGASSKQITIPLLESWCTNLTGFLMFMGGGQRPQVFSQLQVPTPHEFEMFNLSGQKAYIEMRTIDEKRPRNLALPQVVFPASVIPYVKFHADYIRPLIEDITGYHFSGSIRPLLLHISKGRSIKPIEVTRILQRFLASQDASLGKVTAMNLRSSYATMMMKLNRQSEVFTGLTEAQFMDKLAQQMNTSPEQLRRTYIAHDESQMDFNTHDLIKFWQTCLTGTRLRQSNAIG